MSMHSSFRSGGGLSKHRNVLTRRERIDRLKSEGKWSADRDSIFNLPKVRNIKGA